MIKKEDSSFYDILGAVRALLSVMLIDDWQDFLSSLIIIRQFLQQINKRNSWARY